MENAIPSLVIGGLLLVAAAFTAGNSLQSIERVSSTFKDAQLRAGERARTSLMLSNVQLQPAAEGASEGWQRLTFEFVNNGQTRIASFRALDVIVIYRTIGGERASVWLPYSAAELLPNTWTVVAIEGDAFEPGIINPSERAHIVAKLSPPVQAPSTNLLVVISENGVSAEAAFLGVP